MGSLINFPQFKKKQKKKKRKQTDEKLNALYDRGFDIMASMSSEDQDAIESLFLKKLYIQFLDGLGFNDHRKENDVAEFPGLNFFEALTKIFGQVGISVKRVKGVINGKPKGCVNKK